MAANAENDIAYYLLVKKIHLQDLAGIRHWSNLKLGADEDAIWIKGFTHEQLYAIEVKSIPFKTIFYASHGKLCLLKSLLPERSLPALLWTPIDRALPVVLPAFNHNYFGINEKVNIRLVANATEQSIVAILVPLEELQPYIQTAPAIRLKNISWVIINNKQALLIGQPLLPLNGQAFWQTGLFLIPAGLHFEIPFLTDAIADAINPAGKYFVLWLSETNYQLIERTALQTLTIASFRKTMMAI